MAEYSISRDLVGALGHDVARPDDERAAEAGVGTAVADVAGPEPGDPAVPGESELGELNRGPAVHRQHRLAAGLGPRDRPAQLPGSRDDRTVGEGDAGLAPEGAAHVRCDNAELLLRQTGVLHQKVTRQVRVLGGDVRREEGVAVRSRVDEDRVALDRGGRDPLVLDPRPHHDLGVGEGVATVRRVHRPHRLGDVAADLGELQGSAGRQGLLHVDDHVEQVVVDVHELRGVHRLRPGLRDDERDRVADVPDDAVGQRSVPDQLVDLRERRHPLPAERGRGVHGQDAGGALGVRGVEMGDRRVGEGAAHEHGVRRVGDPEVVDVGAPAVDELGVLDPADAVAEDRSHHEAEDISGEMGGRPGSTRAR